MKDNNLKNAPLKGWGMSDIENLKSFTDKEKQNYDIMKKFSSNELKKMAEMEYLLARENFFECFIEMLEINRKTQIDCLEGGIIDENNRLTNKGMQILDVQFRSPEMQEILKADRNKRLI